MSTRDPLLAAMTLLRPRLPRLLVAVALGVLSLGAALALAGVSAWLITRAWQMPPVLDLSIAVVAVRVCAISRAVLHYCERLAIHDTALRAAGAARRQLYSRLAHGPVDAVARLHSGELISRVGTDVDELADVLVRALLPIAVAAALAVAATAVIAAISPSAAVVLAFCLVVAGVFAPWLAARAALTQEAVGRRHHSDRDVSAMIALEHAPELRVAGILPDVIAESKRRHYDWAHAVDAAARPAAVAAAMPTAAIGISVLGAVVAGIQVASMVSPTTLAVLMLLPLSAFEATVPLPAAAVRLTRSRIAARRLLDLAPSDTETSAIRDAPIALAEQPDSLAVLAATELRAGHSEVTASAPVTIELPPGARLALTGPSGSGKTTLLMTLACLIPPLYGQVTLDGTDIKLLNEDELRKAVCFFAEDAHIFATTVRDNLLVVRGDCQDDELTAALNRVGLGRWLADLPDGLATVLPGGAQALSAGQRRRLLLARVLLSPARIVLLDEPTEHLDAADAEPILRELLDRASGLIAADRTVVVATHYLSDDSRSCQVIAVDNHSQAAPARHELQRQ